MRAMIIVYIYRIISDQRKDQRQKLAGDGRHSFDLHHSPLQHLMVCIMHDTTMFDGIDGSKKQQLSHQPSTALGDSASAVSLLAGTDI